MNSAAGLDKSLLYERVREALREQCRREGGSTLPSLRELSRQLNVNHFTISRALRDLEDEGVVKIVPRRGIFIQSFKTQPKSTRIELVTFHTGMKSVSSSLLQGVEEIAGNGAMHHRMLGRPPLPAPDTFVAELRERQVEAVMFNGVSYFQYPHSLEEANLIHAVAQKLPIVIVGGTHGIVDADSVYGDTRPAMTEYLELCLSKGFERYAYLGAMIRRPANRERFECFKDFILANRLEWNESWVMYGSPRPLRESARQLFEQPVIPQVLLAYNADCAYATIIEAQRRGLRPKKDIHILAFVNSPTDVMALQPDATVVLIDEVEIGRRAYQLLQERLSQEPSSAAPAEREPRIERIVARFTNNLLKE